MRWVRYRLRIGIRPQAQYACTEPKNVFHTEHPFWRGRASGKELPRHHSSRGRRASFFAHEMRRFSISRSDLVPAIGAPSVRVVDEYYPAQSCASTRLRRRSPIRNQVEALIRDLKEVIGEMRDGGPVIGRANPLVPLPHWLSARFCSLDTGPRFSPIDAFLCGFDLDAAPVPNISCARKNAILSKTGQMPRRAACRIGLR